MEQTSPSKKASDSSSQNSPRTSTSRADDIERILNDWGFVAHIRQGKHEHILRDRQRFVEVTTYNPNATFQMDNRTLANLIDHHL